MNSVPLTSRLPLQKKRTRMDYLKKFILTRKAWQLFLFFLPFWAIEPAPHESYLITIISHLPFFFVLGWYFLVSSTLINRIPTRSNNFQTFKIITALVLVSLVLLVIVDLLKSESEINSSMIFRGESVITIFLILGFLYCIYFTARILSSTLMGRIADFDDSIINFIWLAVLPIGIWIAQPKIRKIYLQMNVQLKDG